MGLLLNNHSRDSQHLYFFLLQIPHFGAHFVALTASEVFLLLTQELTESKMCVPLIFVSTVSRNLAYNQWFKNTEGREEWEIKDHSGHHPHQPIWNSVPRNFKVVNRTENVLALVKFTVYHVQVLSDHQINHITEDQVITSSMKGNKSRQGDREW